MRRLIGVLALFAALGVLALSASAASAEEFPPASEEEVPSFVEPTTPGEITPNSMSQCSPGTMCAWEGLNFDGNFSWWGASEFGCHSHGGNPNLRSFWNRTPYTVRLGGWRDLGSGQSIGVIGWSESVTGELCWPV